MRGATITIDDAANGGSDAGAWALHIAHTPSLRAQCADEFPRAPSGRFKHARSAVRLSLETDGGPAARSRNAPQPTVVASPGSGRRIG